MPPASHTSSLATCLCRQFRRPLRNPRIVPAYTRRLTTSASQRLEGKTNGSNEIALEPLSELLVLQTPGPRRPRHENLRFVQGPLEAEVLDVTREQLLQYEAMDGENVDIALMRPANTRVSKERYMQLAQQLSKAFLRPQLFEYYRAPDVEGKIPPKLDNGANKAEIIDAVLGAKWGVVASNEIDERLDVLITRSLGYTRKDVFFILWKDGRIIRQWSQDFQARIKVNIQSGAISVNASLENFERLQENIRDLLEKVIEKEFDMSWAQRLCKFNEQFITPIARITGTYIEKTGENTLLISALDSGSLQDARRLLLMSFDLQLRSSHSLLYNAPKGKCDPEGYLYPVHAESALPWNFREAEWGRWRNVKMRIERPESPQAMSSAILKDTLRRRIGGLVQDTEDITTGIREILDHNDLQVPAEHRSKLSTEYEAMLGYLLHEDSNPHPDQELSTPQFIESKNRLQVLLTDVPGLVHIVQDLLPISSSPKAEMMTGMTQALYQTCIVKFLPSPFGYPEGFDRYPPLELKFEIDPKLGQVMNPTLKAIHSSTIADTMFPSEECDVRFHRRTYIPLSLGDSTNPNPDCGIALDELNNYMCDSNLNPLLDTKLKASQFLNVTLPEWTISPPKRSKSEDGGESEERSPPATMQYVSTSLEYRRKVAFDWKGMKLYQTVIQGGITGGKRSEYKLVWSKEGESVAEAPRITEVQDDDEVLDKVAKETADKVAMEDAVSVTEAGDEISTDPTLDSTAEDMGEPEYQITEPITNQDPHHHSSPNPGLSFADFLANTTDLVKSLGKLLSSRQWRFTTQSTEHSPSIQSPRGGMRGRGRGGRGRSSQYNDRATGSS
ncbi:hypothetical protein L873DRAFT_1723776 [Choiromyces venosus 120613-1]|uniref:Uncharacterized protein n=1 Tax=Choiromyces venosus 120613-1 TaxID=1336337 RepID=A0A3N4IST7_9PEZI|nr:hypothetical protein L873DRAFT_1723776 [Choiromyces venosus 120613-1]